MKAADCEKPADLARATGVGDSVISKWLSGEVRPSIPQLRRIFERLGVPLLALVVAAGHLSLEEVAMKELPAPPKRVEGDEVKREIRHAGYPPKVEKVLLKIREDQQAQMRAMIEALRLLSDSAKPG